MIKYNINPIDLVRRLRKDKFENKYIINFLLFSQHELNYLQRKYFNSNSIADFIQDKILLLQGLASKKVLNRILYMISKYQKYEFSWILNGNSSEIMPFQLIVHKLLERLNLSQRKTCLSTLIRVVFSKNTSLPLDTRIDLVNILKNFEKPDNLETQIRKSISEFFRSSKTKYSIENDFGRGLPNNGVDHTYDIPLSVRHIVKLIDKASRRKNSEIRLVLSKHLGNLFNSHLPSKLIADISLAYEAIRNRSESGFYSEEALGLVAEELGVSAEICKAFFVCWNEQVVKPVLFRYGYTISELLRIILLTPQFNLPDPRWQNAKTRFYRSVLKTSSGVVLGLKAGVFHVEHGLETNTSIFYVGKNVAFGKSFMVDTVGGFVAREGAFLGGSFMPILVHTHKHIKKGLGGIRERDTYVPCVFVADKFSRFPMDRSQMFETNNFIGKETGLEGIYALSLNIGEVKT